MSSETALFLTERNIYIEKLLKDIHSIRKFGGKVHYKKYKQLYQFK